MTSHEWIAVGIDGSQGSRAATRWAAAEAQRRGCGLRLVHVFNDYVPLVAFYGAGIPPAALETRERTEAIVREATAEAEQTLPAEQIEAVQLRGDRRAGLVQSAAQAMMIALGGEEASLADHIFTGTVVNAVAAHAATPVVVVPGTWQDDGAERPVVVGVKDCAAAGPLVTRAHELASARGTRLVVLHAWQAPTGYDDLIAAHADVPRWEDTARSTLQGVVDAAASEARKHVEVEVRVVHGQPANVLALASAAAGLLILARRARGFPMGHLGASGRALLHQAHCPVMVVPAAVVPA